MTERVSFLDYVAFADQKNTRYARRTAISLFLEYIFDLPVNGARDDNYRSHLDKLSIQYLADDTRNHSMDLLRFVDYMKQENYAPLSIRDRFSHVKGWYEWNDIIIPPQKMKSIKRKLPKGRPITKKERDISPEMIRNILEYCPLHLKALILVLISSGMRIGEATSIMISDINLESVPAVIQIRDEYTKTKTDRYTFISPEAVNMVRLWLTQRDIWIDRAIKKAKNLGCDKPINDDRLFPINETSINTMLNGNLKKAGYHERDERTNRATISPHLFRGYFISKLTAAGMTPNIVQMLAGHAAPYQGAYEIYSSDQIRDEYNKLHFAISLYASENLPKLRADNESLKESITDLYSEKVKKDRLVDDLSSRVQSLERIANISKLYMEHEAEINEYIKKKGAK